jgi:hypothetical protein
MKKLTIKQELIIRPWKYLPTFSYKETWDMANPKGFRHQPIQNTPPPSLGGQGKQ